MNTLYGYGRISKRELFHNGMVNPITLLIQLIDKKKDCYANTENTINENANEHLFFFQQMKTDVYFVDLIHYPLY